MTEYFTTEEKLLTHQERTKRYLWFTVLMLATVRLQLHQIRRCDRSQHGCAAMGSHIINITGPSVWHQAVWFTVLKDVWIAKGMIGAAPDLMWLSYITVCIIAAIHGAHHGVLNEFFFWLFPQNILSPALCPTFHSQVWVCLHPHHVLSGSSL